MLSVRYAFWNQKKATTDRAEKNSEDEIDEDEITEIADGAMDEWINEIEFQLANLVSELNRLINPDGTWNVSDEARLTELFTDILVRLRMLEVFGPLSLQGYELRTRVQRLQERQQDLERQRQQDTVLRQNAENTPLRDVSEEERRIAEGTPLPDSDVEFRPVLRF